jgi:hypothetical protein
MHTATMPVAQRGADTHGAMRVMPFSVVGAREPPAKPAAWILSPPKQVSDPNNAVAKISETGRMMLPPFFLEVLVLHCSTLAGRCEAHEPDRTFDPSVASTITNYGVYGPAFERATPAALRVRWQAFIALLPNDLGSLACAYRL